MKGGIYGAYHAECGTETTGFIQIKDPRGRLPAKIRIQWRCAGCGKIFVADADLQRPVRDTETIPIETTPLKKVFA